PPETAIHGKKDQSPISRADRIGQTGDLADRQHRAFGRSVQARSPDAAGIPADDPVIDGRAHDRTEQPVSLSNRRGTSTGVEQLAPQATNMRLPDLSDRLVAENRIKAAPLRAGDSARPPALGRPRPTRAGPALSAADNQAGSPGRATDAACAVFLGDTIVPLPAAASRSLPTVASQAIGFAVI